MAKTNKGLVEYCKAQIGKPYWYGTFGNTASSQLLTAKRKQYPSYYDQSKYKLKFTAQYGQRVHDCVGLIKGYLWSETPTSAPKYKASQDVNVGGMLNKATKKGKIATLPEVVGVLVFMTGHVGVYIGNGEVIEAKGHDSGVVQTKLKGRGWTDWAYCPYITYEETPKPQEVTATYFKQYTGKSLSIVDSLKAIGVDSSRTNRARIAAANGIKNYASAYDQNVKLLRLLKAGKLIKP